MTRPTKPDINTERTTMQSSVGALGFGQGLRSTARKPGLNAQSTQEIKAIGACPLTYGSFLKMQALPIEVPLCACKLKGSM